MKIFQILIKSTTCK